MDVKISFGKIIFFLTIFFGLILIELSAVSKLGYIMSLPKQKFREVVLQLLYCYDFKCFDKEGLVSLIMKENKISKTNVLKCFETTELIMGKISLIDISITENCPDYSFERISSVEKNILRLALYEFFFDETIPEKVSIAEGIRLTRKYGTPQSAKFVNAILDAIYKTRI